MNIAVVVPTCRPEKISHWLGMWRPLFRLHHVQLYLVWDSNVKCDVLIEKFDHSREAVPRHASLLDRRFENLIFTRCDSIRNAGFVEALKDGADVIITLDDDVYPMCDTDPILGHIYALAKRVPITWFSPYSQYMRGMPYGVRREAQVKVSHGIWSGDVDVDAIVRTTGSTKLESFPYIGPVPKGCLMPVCGMNLAFTRDVAPYVYFAPMGPKTGFNRFGDIWMGMHLKQWLDGQGHAMMHGMSTVLHERLSDDAQCLMQELPGIQEHELLHSGRSDKLNHKYWSMCKRCRDRWEKLIKSII